VAELPRDVELLERARASAERLVAVDPDLEEPENALLAEALARAYGVEAHEPIRA
jgi:ATP-dependent DNA helicase RecG